MGEPYTSKFVMFDEAQLNIQPATTIDELSIGLHGLIFADIAPFDDIHDGSIEFDWIASERLDTSMYLDCFRWYRGTAQGGDWTSSLFKVLSDRTGLPDNLINSYMRSGSKEEIKDWLQNSLETGLSYREGHSNEHESTLRQLDRTRVLGFPIERLYFDRCEDDPCDARPEDFGNGRRIIVEMKIYWH